MSSSVSRDDAVANNELPPAIHNLPEEANNESTESLWERREQELLSKITEYELKTSQDQQKITQLEKEVQLKNEEKENNKNQILKLEGELTEARKNITDSQEVHSLKLQSEELLTKAKGIIFEKTKVCKNQELQIEALTQQVTSLKEVVGITKDLLDIRNMEVKHLQEKLDNMDGKISGEKERHLLMHSKLEKMIQMNSELKREYETQLCLFNALRERYSERELAKDVVAELNGTGDNIASVNQDTSPTNSTSTNGTVDDNKNAN